MRVREHSKPQHHVDLVALPQVPIVWSRVLSFYLARVLSANVMIDAFGSLSICQVAYVEGIW